MPDFKPMLAKDGDPSVLTYPVAGQIKYDGIRCSIVNGRALTRTLKLVQNREIQEALGRPEFNGLDGELIVGNPTAKGCMQASSSFVMSPDKTGADWTFYVFDKWDEPGNFWCRYQAARDTVFPGGMRPVISNNIAITPTVNLMDQVALIRFESDAVAQGHEGVIIRTLDTPYKFGRSGKKGPLLKIKRFSDSEAEITGFVEEQHNANTPTRNALGRTERSSAKVGKTGKGVLGKLLVRDRYSGVEFGIGTGFTATQRAELWAARENLIGSVVKYKSVDVGVKDKPRFPVFLSFRESDDLPPLTEDPA